MDRNKFMKAMRVITESFGNKITPERLEIYYQYLGHIEDKIFSNAINELISKESYFPPIAKFIEIVSKNIKVPKQSEVRKELMDWINSSTKRNIDKLDHPVYKLMAEEIGLTEQFDISQIDFDNAIKYRYNRIVDEYRSSIINNQPLLLKGNDRDIYPYSNKKIKSNFKKLQLEEND